MVGFCCRKPVHTSVLVKRLVVDLCIPSLTLNSVVPISISEVEKAISSLRTFSAEELLVESCLAEAISDCCRVTPLNISSGLVSLLVLFRMSKQLEWFAVCVKKKHVQLRFKLILH